MSAPAVAPTENQPTSSLWIAWLFGGLAVLLQVALATRYGYFRDELYYLACSDHLAAGYVDFAPLSAWLLHINRVLLGDSLHALRLLPAFAFGAEVVLSGYMARELGAHRWGIFLSCASVLCVPVFGSQTNRYSMNAFEPLFWMGCIYVLLLVVNLQKPRLLIWCGVLLGLGLENKHSTVFFLGALVIGLLRTPQRRLFASKWFWVAAAIALLIALPNFLWQVQHHFPTLEDLRNVKTTHKNIELPPLPFIGAQVLMLNPLHALVWLPGLSLEAAPDVGGITVGRAKAEDALKLTAFGASANDFLRLQEFLPMISGFPPGLSGSPYPLDVFWKQNGFGHPGNWREDVVEFCISTYLNVALSIQHAPSILICAGIFGPIQIQGDRESGPS
jgi:Dolichyl-phosphate-mannose-protein mannosyltransferase